MSHLKKMSVSVMALLTSVQAVGAPISYKLTDSENNRECNAVLDALRSAQLASRSDQQICGLMNSPIIYLLKGKDFRGVQWSEVPVASQAEKENIAKKIYESRIEKNKIGLFENNESRYMTDIRRSLSAGDVIVERAELKYGKKSVYVLQLRRRQCEADYKGYDGIPNWGAFFDRSNTTGLSSNPNTPPGHLFYLDGRLLTLAVIPDTWWSESNTASEKTKLAVSVWSMDANVSANGKIEFSTQLVCNMSIHG